MSDHLEQRMQALRAEMELLEQAIRERSFGPVPAMEEERTESQCEESVGTVIDSLSSPGDPKAGDDRDMMGKRVYSRIAELQRISVDPYFDQFLGQLLRDMEAKKVTPDRILAEAERNYSLYCERMNHDGQSEWKQDNQPLPASAPFVSQPSAPVHSPLRSVRERKATNYEFFIGGGVLSIVGALLFLVAFIYFGVNYLNGTLQGFFLYILSAAALLFSEGILQKKVPGFANGITGLGIGGLYASTIINIFYLETMNRWTGIPIICGVMVVSIFLSRKHDSTGIRLISFIGCYICFLPLSQFTTLEGYLAAIVLLFMVNLIGVFFPNQKNGNRMHLLHMGFNTVFAIIFLAACGADGVVGYIFMIFNLILNVILLNVVYLRQEKGTVNTVFFCVESGILYFFAVGIAISADQPTFFTLGTLYTRMITLCLILAVCLFFYIFHQDKRAKVIQIYCLQASSLVLFVMAGSRWENLFVVLILFITVKLVSHNRDYEVMNGIITIFAFMAGLQNTEIWPSWLLFVAFIFSIPLIRRWHLFYQYIISLFLVLFISVQLPYNIVIPLNMILLFGLVPAFHFCSQKSREKASRRNQEGETAKEKARKKYERMDAVYNYSNLVLVGWISFLAAFCDHLLSGVLVMITGALYIVLYMTPRFFRDIKMKYLILAGYVTIMAFLIRVENPVFISAFLMMIAIACVVYGFKVRNKEHRLCGLVLTIFVCIKLVLFDFNESGSLQKIILSMIVGGIVLGISLIYIRFEKNHSEMVTDAEVPEQEEQSIFIRANAGANRKEPYEGDEKIACSEWSKDMCHNEEVGIHEDVAHMGIGGENETEQ